MSAELKRKPKLDKKTSQAPSKQGLGKKPFIAIDPAREGQMLELSLAEIEADFKPQWETLPFLLEIEDIHSESGYLRKTQEDVDDDEFYDSPDMEQNIEKNWTEDDVKGYEAVTSENLLQYAWRRWEEDFLITGDEKADRVAAVLTRWSPPYFPLMLASEDEELRPWFDVLKEEIPGQESEKPVVANLQPDIIFSFNSDGKMNYEINLGYLDRLLIDKSFDTSDCKIPWVKTKKGVTTFVEVDVLPGLRQARRKALSMMAEFLIENQKPFLSSAGIGKAVLKLQPRMQNDFVEFTSQKGLKKDKTWAARVVANKMVKVPFSNELFPLDFFFNMNMTFLKLTYLRKILDIHISQGQNQPLSAVEQAMILRALFCMDVNEQQVRKTLWAHLQQIFPEHLWDSLKIIGSGGTQKNSDQLPYSDLKNLVQLTAKACSLSVDDEIMKNNQKWKEAVLLFKKQ